LQLNNPYIIPTKPIPASRPRVTRGATFYSKSYQKYKEFLNIFLPSLRLKKIFGAIEVKIIFYVPIPTSWDNPDLVKLHGWRFKTENLKTMRKHHKAELEGQLAITYADTDNLEKALFDGLNGVAYRDDMVIARVLKEKRYSNNPRTEFELKEIK